MKSNHKSTTSPCGETYGEGVRESTHGMEYVTGFTPGGREIVVEAALGLQFVQKQLTAKAGEVLTLVFKNPDVVPHNWLLARPGSLQRLGEKCNLMITDPQGLAKHYVPDSGDVLAYTDMVNPQQTFTIHITAPSEPGDYPYLCTFPGHWMIMNGVLRVE